jgi:hypothetical protein
MSLLSFTAGATLARDGTIAGSALLLRRMGTTIPPSVGQATVGELLELARLWGRVRRVHGLQGEARGRIADAKPEVRPRLLGSADNGRSTSVSIGETYTLNIGPIWPVYFWPQHLGCTFEIKWLDAMR